MAQQVIASVWVCRGSSGLSKHLGYHLVRTALLLGVLDRWKSMAAAELLRLLLCYLHWCALERVAEWRDAEAGELTLQLAQHSEFQAMGSG